jgi:glycine dehydrogenase
MTEYEFANHIRLLGRTNKVYKSYIGLVTTQQLFRRQFKEIFLKTRVGTPLQYQAEIAQGRLEAILNFQTMVIELTGMEIANAYSTKVPLRKQWLYCLMFAQRSKKSNVNKFFVSEEILPQTLSVLQTRSEPIG